MEGVRVGVDRAGEDGAVGELGDRAFGPALAHLANHATFDTEPYLAPECAIHEGLVGVVPVHWRPRWRHPFRPAAWRPSRRSAAGCACGRCAAAAGRCRRSRRSGRDAAVITTTRSARKHRLGDAVGDEEDGLAAARCQMRSSSMLHLLARQRVERAERLVHQQELRDRAAARGQIATRCAHAARELVRVRALEARRGRPARAARARARASRASRCLRISAGSSTLSSTVRQGSSTALWNTMPRSSGGPIDRLAGRRGSRPPDGRHQAGDHLEQRALAAAARPEDGDELTLAGLQRQASTASVRPERVRYSRVTFSTSTKRTHVLPTLSSSSSASCGFQGRDTISSSTIAAYSASPKSEISAIEASASGVLRLLLAISTR